MNATKTTRKNKATHTGCCQVCDHRQKLPNGLMAKHGYNVRWGFFSGTCYGSDHQPFEVATDLIEESIRRAESHAASLRAQAAADRASNDPASCWYHVYFEADWNTRKSEYAWRKVAISQEGFLGFVHPKTSERERMSTPEGRGVYNLEARAYDLEKAAAYFNGKHAEYLEREASQVDMYVTWQKNRIKNWAPQPLKEIA